MRRVGAIMLGLLCTVAAVTAPIAHAGAAPPPPRSTVYALGGAYPRIIRLTHSGTANGTILASVNTIQHNDGIGVISASADDGRTWHQIASIADPAAANGAQECCASLFELPSPVGSMPAGTVLWVDGTGYGRNTSVRRVEQRLWASRDHGVTWKYISDIADPVNPYPTWETSLSVSADGQLVAMYSDETDKTDHDQKLVQTRSADGIRWDDYTVTVVSDDWYVRPGMANVVRLPNGTYFMTYEVCNNDLVHPCAAYHRESADGWDYGDPTNLGTVIRTTDGKYGRHTPVVAWSAGPGPNGTILVIPEMTVNADGSVAPENGKVIFANDDLGAGPWYEIPAPIAVDGVDNAGCRNFSSSILPSADGKTVLEAANDFDANGICETYAATAPLTEP
jgi:hypothetical protein